ncbi:transcription termination factor Rho, partial [Leucobacter chromiiresistens]
AQSSDATAAAAEPEAPAKRTRSRRATSASAASKTDDAASAATDAAQSDAPAGAADDAARSDRNSEQAERGEQERTEQSERSEQDRGEKTERGEKSDRGDRSDRGEKSENGDGERSSRGRRGRGRNQKNENADANEQVEAAEDEGKQRGQNGNGGQNGPKNAEAKNGENSSRSSRTRQRDRKRRGQGDDIEPEITEDDVLLPIAGILDVLDNYAFVRTSGYLPGTSDVYVSLGQVKKYGLRRGDAVVGAIRQPRDNDGASRQKYNAIVKIDTVNGRPVDEQAEERVDIADLTAIYPEERLRFETDQQHVLGRAIDLVAPTGLGQRTALVLPAHLDGSAVLGELAEAVSANRPDAHLMLLLANAQPEEITRLQRSVRGEVVAASFDRAAEDQAIIAELAIDRAKRLVELGHDVVVLVDSLNRFARAYAQAQHAQTRPALDEIDELALAQIKRLLASARNVENGGSLTVVATVQSKTGIAADKLLLREVLAVVNSEVRFAKTAAGLPAAVDFEASRTRNPESMLGADEIAALATLRAALHEDDADDRLRERLRSTATNAALLAEVQRSGSLS